MKCQLLRLLLFAAAIAWGVSVSAKPIQIESLSPQGTLRWSHDDPAIESFSVTFSYDMDYGWTNIQDNLSATQTIAEVDLPLSCGFFKLTALRPRERLVTRGTGEDSEVFSVHLYAGLLGTIQAQGDTESSLLNL